MQDFKPINGQQGQMQYKSLKQAAIAMGLKPDNQLAARLTAPARAERNKIMEGDCI